MYNIDLFIGIVFIIYFFILTVFLGKISFKLNILFIGIFLILFHFIKSYLIKITFIQQLLYFCKPLFILFLICFITIELLTIIFSFSKNISKCDYVLILGAALKNNKPSKVLQYRLDAAVDYLENSKDVNCKLILSGGIGKNEVFSEALAMKTYLLENGISENRLILEDKSKNTFENFKFSKELILKISKKSWNDIHVKVVTSNFHCFRSYILSKKNSYKKVTLYRGKTNILLGPNYFLREFFAIIKSLFFDS